MNTEVRRQEKLNWAEEKDFRRAELPEKYTAKLPYGWDDKLTLQRPWDYAIEIIPGTSLKNCKIYLLMTRKQQELDKFLEEHLKLGRIQHSKFPYVISFFFVKKNMAHYGQFKITKD